jgi:malic enzyme
VAAAVALAAVQEGLATRASTREEAMQCLEQHHWKAHYPSIRPK